MRLSILVLMIIFMWMPSKGFGNEFEGFEKDSGFEKDLERNWEDLERILDLERIWKGI